MSKEIFLNKLKLDLTYSSYLLAAGLDLLDFTATKQGLPISMLSATSSNKQTSPNQNDRKSFCRLATETMKNFENLIIGHHSAAFCKITDNLTSEYESLEVDNAVFFDNFC